MPRHSKRKSGHNDGAAPAASVRAVTAKAAARAAAAAAASLRPPWAAQRLSFHVWLHVGAFLPRPAADAAARACRGLRGVLRSAEMGQLRKDELTDLVPAGGSKTELTEQVHQRSGKSVSSGRSVNSAEVPGRFSTVRHQVRHGRSPRSALWVRQKRPSPSTPQRSDSTSNSDSSVKRPVTVRHWAVTVRVGPALHFVVAFSSKSMVFSLHLVFLSVQRRVQWLTRAR